MAVWEIMLRNIALNVQDLSVLIAGRLDLFISLKALATEAPRTRNSKCPLSSVASSLGVDQR